MFFRRKIKALGRAGIQYRAEPIKLRIDAEFFFDPLGVTIFCESRFKEIPSGEVVEMLDSKKIRIIDEVANYFRSKGYVVRLHPSETEV